MARTRGAVGTKMLSGWRSAKLLREGGDLGGAVSVEEGLRGEVIGVVGEGGGIGCGGGQDGAAIGVDGFGVALIKGVGVAEGEVGGGSLDAGMRLRVGGNAGEAGRATAGAELLGHGAELRGGGEGRVEADDALCGGGAGGGGGLELCAALGGG